jgi:hypothetical protein
VTAPVLDQQLVLHDRSTAEAAVDRLRLTLTDAHEQLIDLWRRKAHVAYGQPDSVAGWAVFVAAEFGQLLNVLPTAEQLQAMSDAGMPQRALAAPFGVSLGTVNARLRELRAPAPAPEPDEDPRPTYAIVAAAVAAAGARGLTIPQAQRRLGWTYGAVSGALSRAEAKGLIRRPADLDKRSGYRPYTAVTA